MTTEELATMLDDHAKWLRGEGSGSRADLYGANLAGANLSGANLSGANLSGANLSDANLSDANLSDANLASANLADANLADAYLARAYLSDANLAGAYLSDANLASANLSDANLAGANLSRAYLSRAYLSRANLSRANLSDANLAGANLAGTNLADANLAGTNLYRADLTGADLTRTCLAKSASPFDWARNSSCDMRVCGGRILVLASRTRSQPVMNGPEYEPGTLYVAPVFSRDAGSDCHPGLYVAGGPTCDLAEGQERLLVACWLDELFVADKCRVPRFRTVAAKAEFDRLTAADMEPSAAEVDHRSNTGRVCQRGPGPTHRQVHGQAVGLVQPAGGKQPGGMDAHTRAHSPRRPQAQGRRTASAGASRESQR